MKFAYIYAGEGVSSLSVEEWISVLREYIPSKSSLSILKTNATTIVQHLSNQSPDDTILVMPGGADIPYVQALAGEATSHIRTVIQAGAIYIGTCAGAYFASSACIFEPHNPELRIVAPRALALFPLPAIGAAKSGYSYGSEAGASFESLKICLEPADLDVSLTHCERTAKVYCNGGPAWPCVYDHIEPTMSDEARQNKEATIVLARYSNPVLARHGIHDDPNPAAILVHKFENGVVILSGVHPELTPHKRNKKDGTFVILRAILHYAGLSSHIPHH